MVRVVAAGSASNATTVPRLPRLRIGQKGAAFPAELPWLRMNPSNIMVAIHN
jgi:hypothetical protein